MFIRELFERGIPPEACYFYCRGLKSLHGTTLPNETTLSAAELRNAILDEIPRYGVRPAVSAYLHAAKAGQLPQQLGQIEEYKMTFAHVLLLENRCFSAC
jgi:hypothetical protein